MSRSVERRLESQVPELKDANERVQRLETALREIGNRAGRPTSPYAEGEQQEQRESLDWIASKVKEVLRDS